VILHTISDLLLPFSIDRSMFLQSSAIRKQTSS